MAKNSQKNSTNQRALQPNAAQYQQRGDANSPQQTGNTGAGRSTKRNNNLGDIVQSNAASFQFQTNHPGAAQIAGNDVAARQAEAGINSALGAGWGPVGGAAQAKANPKGVGKIPTGATGVLPRKLPPRKGK